MHQTHRAVQLFYASLLLLAYTGITAYGKSSHRHRAALAASVLHGFTFQNKSLDVGGAVNDCSGCNPEDSTYMEYTATRTWPDTPAEATAAVVLALQLRSSSFAYLRTFWTSWLEHALPHVCKQPVVIIMTEPAVEQGDNFVAETSSALGLQPADCAIYAAGCLLVSGLGLQPFVTKMANEQELLVLIGEINPKHAWWLLRHPRGEMREAARKDWKPLTPCIAPYDWARHTQWYAYPALKMPILDYFDFFFKVDSDIAFEALPLSEPLAVTMAQKHRLFLHTQEADEPEDCVGPRLKELVTHFIDMESERCECPRIAVSQGDPWFERPVSAYYANFVGGWLGFFTSPEVLRFSATWWNWPQGPWSYRWTDQQFWTQVLGMYAKQSDVEDMSFLRAHFHHKPNLEKHVQQPQ